MIFDEIKVVIDTNLPQNREELVWIINNLGKYLFDEDLWEQNNIYKNEDEKHPNVIEGILQLIEKVVQNSQEKEELIKYLFSITINKLSHMNKHKK